MLIDLLVVDSSPVARIRRKKSDGDLRGAGSSTNQPLVASGVYQGRKVNKDQIRQTINISDGHKTLGEVKYNLAIRFMYKYFKFFDMT